MPRQTRAGVDGDEVTEQPIKALPFKGRVGWGWVSPPHKHQQREGQPPWKARATHGSGKNNANENFDATRLTPNANSGNPCEANSSMARSSEGRHRKSVVQGKTVPVRVDPGGRRNPHT